MGLVKVEEEEEDNEATVVGIKLWNTHSHVIQVKVVQIMVVKVMIIQFTVIQVKIIEVLVV